MSSEVRAGATQRCQPVAEKSDEQKGSQRRAAVRPRVNAELDAVLHVLRDEYRDGAWTRDSIGTMRQLWDCYAPTDQDLSCRGRVEIEEVHIPAGPDCPALQLLVLRPRGKRSRTGIYHIHGGGLIAGTNRAGLSLVLRYILEYGVTVFSIGYRLAPENPFPAAFDDCFRGYMHLLDNANELGVDPLLTIVFGASAGGGLAASTTIKARDLGVTMPRCQILLSPMIDDRGLTASSRYEGIPWDAVSNRTGWEALLGAAAGTDGVSPYAAAARAAHLFGMPPTYLEVGGAEVFRDEVVMFAARLLADDVPVELHVWDGATHGFDSYAPHATVSAAAVAARDSFVRRLLAP